MDPQGLQLEMNFGENRNRFKDCLQKGDFCVVFELNAPSKKNEFKNAVSKALEIEFAASAAKKTPVSFAFTDKIAGPDCWNVLHFASEVCPNDKDRSLIFMSGKNFTREDQINFLASAKTAGFMNIAPVSGDAEPGEDASQTSKRVYTEGIHALWHIKNSGEKFFFPGCVVNPFKYNPAGSFSQYYKLIKKFNNGAEFAVAQCGWDILKYQELRWYLSSRGYHYPTLARLLFLTPERVEAIAANKGLRMSISPDFERLLKSELSCSAAQFEAAQWRRMQIQAAGCRLLGYSGIQIAGIDNSSQAATACQKISEAFEEFGDNFDEWKEVYFERMSNIEMAPYPHRYYMFNNLFSRPHLDENPSMNNADLPECGSNEKMFYKISEFFLSNAHLKSPGEHYLLKKILAGCKTCSFCRLPLTHYICPEECPKGLANGPCGGANADGTCEVGDKECVHDKRMRLASWLNEIDSLEEKYIRPADRPGCG